MHPNTQAEEMDALLKRLFPICRSLTGAGTRETFSILKEYLPLVIQTVPSGSSAFDWIVPKEWNIQDAYIKDASGTKVVDFKNSNLHVMNYSIPVHTTMTLEELKPHLYSLPEQPDVIPYRTSYYAPAWGFCLTHKQLEGLKDGTYEVAIESTLEDGTLAYGELYIPGATSDEILLSTYVCHPSLANDNLSGPVLLAMLGKKLIEQQKTLHYSYRLVFVPETIGSLVWLSRNEAQLLHIKHGLVVTCVGDPGPFTYKKTRDGNQPIDRAVQKVLTEAGSPHVVLDFYPSGSDELQYCSPALNLPVGSLMRTPYQRYPEYHTSADNLSLVNGAQIAETLALYERVLATLEEERGETYRVRDGRGEPQLGKRNLYASTGGVMHNEPLKQALVWVLNLSDGTWSLSDIAERSKLPRETIQEAATLLRTHNLIEPL